MPTMLYSRVPAAAIRTEIDGNAYAYIPHKLDGERGAIVEDFDAPRLVRFGPESFVRNGEAYVYFGKLGDALPMPSVLPFGVSTEQRNTEGRITREIEQVPTRAPIVNVLTYRGWRIDYNPARPVTGQWRAERFGVGMCAGSRDALTRMIDTRAR